MSNNKPTIDQIMRLHRLTVKSFFDMQSMTNAEKEEVNELERQFGMLDHIEIMNDEIEILKEKLSVAESQIEDLKLQIVYWENGEDV